MKTDLDNDPVPCFTSMTGGQKPYSFAHNFGGTPAEPANESGQSRLGLPVKPRVNARFHAKTSFYT